MKTPNQIYDLLEDMFTNNYQWHSIRGKMAKQATVHQAENDQLVTMAQVK